MDKGENNMQKTGALVIGGHSQGLGIMRMLGEKGVPVYLLDTNSLNISRYSRYCKKFIHVPSDIYASDETFVRSVTHIKEVYGLQGAVVFPTDDQSVAFLSRNKEVLSRHYTIWTDDWEKIKFCYNKKLSYGLAEANGIPCPRSYYPESREDVEKLAKSIEYPVIVKPAVMHEFYRKTKNKVFLCNDAEELKQNYERAIGIIGPADVIIQEVIPGNAKNLYSLGSFYKEGRIAYVVARRARQIPMDFGKASTFVELTDIPEIYDLGVKVLEMFKYYGLSEVEFKYDDRDGQYKFLEINPRTWKWHSITALAGINLPYALYCDLMGIDGSSGPFEKKPVPCKWIDIYTDIYVSLKEIIGGRMSIADYVRSIGGRKMLGDLSISDPLPFIAETILLPYLLRR